MPQDLHLTLIKLESSTAMDPATLELANVLLSKVSSLEGQLDSLHTCMARIIANQEGPNQEEVLKHLDLLSDKHTAEPYEANKKMLREAIERIRRGESSIT